MTPLFAHKKSSADRGFERLYKAHVQDVYRYSLMVLRNAADAEDVVQTTFMKAYRAFERGERPRNARHWLIAIAHNTCRTRIRDAKRRPQEVAFEERLVDHDAPEHETVDARELLHALGALSFNQRSALVMRELEGRSYAEIAQLLEITTSAVETLLFRARRAVREQLEGALTCGEAELALSKQLDRRLDAAEQRKLRAHLRECGECAGLARRERARRAALRSLGPLSLPGSLATWGGGAAVGTGVAVKAAAIVAAAITAAGVAFESAAPAEAGDPALSHETNARAPAVVPSRAKPVAVARTATQLPARGRQHPVSVRVSTPKHAPAGDDPAVNAAAAPAAQAPAHPAATPATTPAAAATDPVAAATQPIPVSVPKQPVAAPTVAVPAVQVPQLPVAVPAVTPPPPPPVPDVLP